MTEQSLRRGRSVHRTEVVALRLLPSKCAGSWKPGVYMESDTQPDNQRVLKKWKQKYGDGELLKAIADYCGTSVVMIERD
jgi:hypothetical protein